MFELNVEAPVTFNVPENVPLPFTDKVVPFQVIFPFPNEKFPLEYQ